MKKDHCNYCEQELTDRFENEEIPEYITVNDKIHFCHKVCQEMEHEHNCSKENIESDDASSICNDCGLYSEDSRL